MDLKVELTLILSNIRPVSAILTLSLLVAFFSLTLRRCYIIGG